MPAKQPFSPKARRAARQRVLQALYQWQMTEQAIEIIESQFLVEMKEVDSAFSDDGEKLNQVDMPYFKRLLSGITQQVIQLEQQFIKFLDRDITALDPIELAILRIGSYELIYCPDVPFKVAINESVELAKKFGAEQSHKYVNGILDQLAQHNQPKSFNRSKKSALTIKTNEKTQGRKTLSIKSLPDRNLSLKKLSNDDAGQEKDLPPDIKV